MRGLRSKISKAQRHQLEFQKQESICLNFIRAINEILKPEGYDIEFRKRKGTKLITTHTNKENICIHIHTQIISRLKYSSSTSFDWCVIQSQTIFGQEKRFRFPFHSIVLIGVCIRSSLCRH